MLKLTVAALACLSILLPASPPLAPALSAQDAPEGTAATMQGVWQSTDDPRNVIEISGYEVVSRYDGEVVAISTLTFVAGCDDHTAVPDGKYFLLAEEDLVLCYYLLEAGVDRLEYSYVDRGNTLSYRRVDEPPGAEDRSPRSHGGA